MQKFLGSFILSSCLLLVSLYSGAQSVLNPADTITEYNPLTLPAQPTFGQIGKWVRTKSMNWNATEYKAYIYKGCAFRLHYPKSYNPTAADGKKYPLIIMFHGRGEAGPITDNEMQLTHAGQLTEQLIDSGNCDCYAMFMQSQDLWGGNQYQYITEIIEYMAANNKLDRFRVYVHGLSGGGQAAWEILLNYPTYIACSLPLSSNSIGYKDTSIVNAVKFTPIWNFQGGVDGSPAPSTSEQVRDAMVAAGGNYTYTEYPNLGHDTWDSALANPNFFPFMLNTYMSNPWALYGRTAFCPGDTINVTLGLARGFDGYQWRKDSTVISTATTNTLHVTLPGKYDARIKKGTTWSDWSHTPINIIIKTATITPPITVAGAMSDVIPATDGNNYVNLQVPDNGYINYSWVKTGSSTVIGTQRILKVTQPGSYQVSAFEKYGCSSVISPAFTVVSANGPNPPNAATNLVARALSFTQIELDWARNPKPAYSETAFEIYRGTTSGGPYTYVGQVPADTITYIDNSLTPNVKYYYKIRAIDTTAASPASNEANATTQSDKTPPTTPDSLTIPTTNRNSITLTWHASTDNVGVYAYDIYINGTKSYTTPNTTFIVSGLQSFKQYSFYVKARDVSGNVSQPSNQACGTTILQGFHYKYYEFNWTAVPNFNLYTPVKQGYSTFPDLSVKNKATNFGMLWQGYIIIPVDGTYKFETNSDDGSKLWIGSQYNPTATPLVNNDGTHGPLYAAGTITLKAGVYPISIGYFQYLVSSSITLYWSCKNLFGDTVLRQIGNQYFNDSYTPAGTPPAMPTNVSAVATSYNKVSLSWKDNSTNETGFEIYRATNPAGEFTIVNTTPAGTTSFVDSTAAASTTYYYRIQAVNNYGGSGYDPLSAGQLSYSYYEGTGWTAIPNLDSLTPIKTGFVNNINNTTLAANRNKTVNFAFKFAGIINIPTTGSYTFLTNSYDGSMLYINGLASSNLVVNNDGKHTGLQKSGVITLAKGSYPFYVKYFNASGITGIILTYKGPSIATQVIPDSVFINKQSSTTTFALPAKPAVPTSFTAASISPYANTLSWSSVTGATSFQIYRSIGDTTKFKYLSTLSGSATTYTDSSLFGNINYYYKINSTGVGGTSAFSVIDSARTKDNPPVIVKVPVRLNARYSTTTTIPFSATDADGDSLVFTIQNMPSSFGTFTSNGNQTATLTLNPTSNMQGYYNNVKVIVSDNNGGTDSTTFNLVVNNHINPTLDSIPNYTLNENDTLSIPLIAFETSSTDSISWTITNLPNSNTITPVSNGVNTLFLHPTYAAAGVYNAQVSISDTDGGYATQQFTITVNYKNPNINVYARFEDLDNIGAPWNNITSTTSTNFKDANGNSTSIGFSLPSSWYATWHEGPTTGNNSGIYPDAVLKDYFYFGIFGGPNSITAKVTGLDTSRSYNLTLYAGSAWSGAANNGTTSFTVNSQTDSLNVQNNTQ
ncbi:MAG TPA: PA14 domain-containing protein, partial [Flavipsychrobacter sp.]|nr:PA14 domain-containing protein [Flavipsychrobacter sp.]